jgi:predicted site-specific integrase-resolvase
MNTAVIYARVSSVGERQNNERQIEDLKILGERENYTIQKIY